MVKSKMVYQGVVFLISLLLACIGGTALPLQEEMPSPFTRVLRLCKDPPMEGMHCFNLPALVFFQILNKEANERNFNISFSICVTL